MKRFLSSPWFWLPLLALVAFAMHFVRGDLRVHVVPDTPNYRDFDFSSFEAALSQRRTVGYPLFLKSLDAIGVGFDGVPFAQFAVSVLAAGVFYWGLATAGFRRPAAIAATGALFFVHARGEFLATAMTDSLACSLAAASAGAFFAVISRRGGVWAYLALGLATFLTYQVRPAYLFLLPLWPLLGLALEMFLTRRDDPLRVRLLRFAGCLATVAVPFVAFCALRGAVVGHFGLVSFGGYNVVGVAGQFLDEPLAQEMPEDLRPLAEEIVRRRPTVKEIVPPTDIVAMENSFNPTVWALVAPIVEERYGEDDVAANDALTRLSREIFRRRPESLARWLFLNGKHAVRQCLTLALTDPATLLALLAVLALHAWNLIRRPRLDAAAVDDSSLEIREARRIERHLLVWTSLAYCAAKAALVVWVEPAIGRYMYAAILLIPTAVAIWPMHYAEWAFGRRDPVDA